MSIKHLSVNFISRSLLLAIFTIFSLANPLYAAQVNEMVNEKLKEINLGILSLAPPLKTYKNWKPFANYLENAIGIPVNIIAPRGFGKLKKMAEKKQVDLFYVNSHIFYLLKQADKAVAIAQMENIEDSTTSQSSIFVRSDSEINNVSQLKGKTFAFVSPMGAGGYLAPRAYLYQHGLKTKRGFNSEVQRRKFQFLQMIFSLPGMVFESRVPF
ncbi:phosphate/phosphite/phosphonate ABC transporter substrate-binding protein [sulfur-oxidizing endosymbiont of Gigantopelta aegis]|uniref:phosphate/phosphite/phosphonate ABC transporter substrate-binding protein n=1 Tax=sulfur-oxidizing endosymbiont of Gigantopelta aegis TaxID=2794934 RepID=UPI0018DE623A|nr:PhnD/SsuA/transferrin family substrate-binding protein [sulfur-oxidizing endosymbiont of Gigantopelta aegis]